MFHVKHSGFFENRVFHVKHFLESVRSQLIEPFVNSYFFCYNTLAVD